MIEKTLFVNSLIVADKSRLNEIIVLSGWAMVALVLFCRAGPA